MPEDRDAAVDALRTTVTLLVVLHHAILAYAVFGHFDRQHYLWSTAPIVDDHRWAGFDLVILFNDGWFMAAMFAIAGLFVLPGLRRYGPVSYLRRRVLRLGVPFALAAAVVMPLAYYPSYELTGATGSYWQFWYDTVLHGPWSAGPAWFLWVLLAFDAAAAGLSALRLPAVEMQPARLVTLALVIAMVGTAGCELAFRPDRWFGRGPFWVQASRIVLYATSFGLGVLAGPRLIHLRLRVHPVACLILFAGLVYLQFLRPGTPVFLWRGVYSGVFVAFCFVTGLSALALARRCPAWLLQALQSLGPDAFWIYVVHYLPMVWLQYALLPVNLPGAAKGFIVFLVTLGSSWMLAAGTRLALARSRRQRMPSTSIMS